jgi:hypothetical protein
MKIEALRRLIETQGKVKVFVATDLFCLCGYAVKQQQTTAGVFVEIGASLRFVFASATLIREAVSSGTLVLSSVSQITRRLQTHRRHVAGRAVPEHYFAEALAL